MPKDTEAAALRTLPWVKKVTKNKKSPWDKDEHPGYTITTKPGKLTVLVTHGVQVKGDSYRPGAPLAKPFKVGFPSMEIKLRIRKGETTVRITEQPKTAHESFLPYPAYDRWHIRVAYWNHEFSPCWGEVYANLYRGAETFHERAQIVAEYPQTAVPHIEENRGGAVYAYLLGHMPEEHVKRLGEDEEWEEHYIEDGEGHWRDDEDWDDEW